MPQNKSLDIFQQLTTIFRTGNLAKRKIKNYKIPSASTALEIFRKSHGTVYSNVLSQFGQYDRLCISLQTLIPIPGPERFKTLQQLIQEYPNGEKFIIYAYDHKKEELVPAWAHHPRSSGFKETVKITFDDGKTLVCTPDHPCMMRDGTYKDAGLLIAGDSMMPFYRKEFNGKRKDNKFRFIGYENIYNLKKWVAEHRLITEWDNNRQILKDLEHVHHVDFNPKNNNPENLQILSKHDHLQLHGRMAKQSWENPTIRQKILDGFNNSWKNNEKRKERLRNFNRSSEIVEKRREHAKNDNPTLKLEVRQKISQKAKERFQNPEEIKKSSERTKQLYRDGILKVNENFVYFNKGKYLSEVLRNLSIEKIIELCKKENLYKSKEIALILQISNSSLVHFVKKNCNLDWRKFIKQFVKLNNHKIISVEKYEILEVGDLTVDGFQNFATSEIVVHNSRVSDFAEMSGDGIIHTALKIYAGESVAKDENKKALHIYSENEKIKKILTELFFDTLNVNFNLYSWVYTLCKYGDAFFLNDISPNYGVLGMYAVPINELEVEEGYDPKNPLAKRYRWVTQGNVLLQNWQISHLKLLENDAYYPYGTSILDGARRIWRQLILLEDAMLVYRIVRSPERRVFYIDVSNVSEDNVANYIEQVRTSFKNNSVIDASEGRVDLRYSPQSVDQDYFVGIREGSETKIDTLPGGQHVSAVDDVEYIQNKLFSALEVPKSYITGGEDGGTSKANLSQLDIRFSRTIERIQEMVLSELNKVAMIHLLILGFEGEDLVDFDIKLSNPSSIAEQQRTELLRSRLEIVTQQEGFALSNDWYYKNILNFTQDDIEEERKNLLKDRMRQLQMNMVKGEDEGGDGAGEDLDSMLGGGGDDLMAGKSPEYDNVLKESLSAYFDVSPQLFIEHATKVLSKTPHLVADERHLASPNLYMENIDATIQNEETFLKVLENLDEELQNLELNETDWTELSDADKTKYKKNRPSRENAGGLPGVWGSGEYDFMRAVGGGRDEDTNLNVLGKPDAYDKYKIGPPDPLKEDLIDKYINLICLEEFNKGPVVFSERVMKNDRIFLTEVKTGVTEDTHLFGKQLIEILKQRKNLLHNRELENAERNQNNIGKEFRGTLQSRNLMSLPMPS